MASASITIRARWVCLSLVMVLVGCGPARQDESAPTIARVPDVGSSSRDGREILERSAKALCAIGSVRYKFEIGEPESAAGWLTGSATLVRRTRFEDAAI